LYVVLYTFSSEKVAEAIELCIFEAGIPLKMRARNLQVSDDSIFFD